VEISKEQKVRVFQRIFQGNEFREGDFVRFRTGRSLYQIPHYRTELAGVLELTRLPIEGSFPKTVLVKEKVVSRLEKVSERIAFYYLCYKSPEGVQSFFLPKTAKRLFRKYLKPIKRGWKECL